jgi:Mg2+ and Co2+ transporter CorA
VVDEVVSINNRQKVNKVIKKFDDEALKVQRMMTQAQQVILTAHRECISAIRAMLTTNDIGQGVNNSVNTSPRPAKAPVVNDNANEGSNTVQKIPQQEDEIANMNDVQQ